ncbi:MAG: B12-binding domain-containing radical SAM protein [Elusimicrobiales bacterium]|nr:B12-binding domain-containing radical SAM protein [Elusimicrobiales bacterium]
MRILLIKASSITKKWNYPPLGLMYISSVLKGNNKNYINILHSGFHSDDEIKKMVSEFKPDIAGISAITAEATSFHNIAKIIKNINKKCTVLSGGHYPTYYYDDIMKDENIDFIIRGEGEYPIKKFMEYIEGKTDLSGVPGLVYKKNNQMFLNNMYYVADINLIPEPDWDSVKNYIGKFTPQSPVLQNEKFISLYTSRGCSFNCEFCHNLMGKTVRAHNPERVISEIKKRILELNIKKFEIVDDFFNYDLNRIKSILKNIISNDLNSEFYICGIRMDMLDDETIELMKKANVKYVSFGIENINNYMQIKIGKRLNKDNLSKNIKKLYKTRIFMTAGIVIGLEDESIKSILQTLLFTIKNPIHSIMIANLRRYKGIYDTDYINAGNDNDYYWEISYSGNIKKVLYLNFTKILMNLIFYLNPFKIYIILRDTPRLNSKVFKTFFIKFIKRVIPF